MYFSCHNHFFLSWFNFSTGQTCIKQSTCVIWSNSHNPRVSSFYSSGTKQYNLLIGGDWTAVTLTNFRKLTGFRRIHHNSIYTVRRLDIQSIHWYVLLSGAYIKEEAFIKWKRGVLFKLKNAIIEGAFIRDKRRLFERGRLCDHLRYLVLINWCAIRTLLLHTSYVHTCDFLHFLKNFSQMPRNLSDSMKPLDTESPYIHRVSAPVKDEFSTAAVELSSIENSIVVHEIIRNILYITHAI